ncbi:IS5 family transposase [Hymenobacter metallilatus]|uniref:IS5 family transposase n=1 Tax=Hymenobacter metallilatus TaxID=2493666 RepID=A0A428IXL9_9BACT|nr:IS5 family transposase [Hymenobacter metallilatus]RSK23802.1 IS5 family transposase [Hymenobacter metallilatus]
MVDGYQPLTDSQWQVIELLLPVQRRRRLCLRQVFNALLYVCRTGCQWRALPSQFPPWTAVYYYFYRWQRLGLWQHLNTVVNALDRVAHGREPTPALACVDSQSVKLAPRIYEHRGLDAHKLVNGRKRQLLVDSGGRIWAAHVHAAHRHDSTGALALLPQRPWWARRLQLVLTDAAYRGRFAQHLLGLGLVQQISSRPPTQRGFVPLARRWVVERTFAWLACFRRVVVDYEFTPASHVAWLLLANITMSLNRV